MHLYIDECGFILIFYLCLFSSGLQWNRRRYDRPKNHEQY